MQRQMLQGAALMVHSQQMQMQVYQHILCSLSSARQDWCQVALEQGSCAPVLGSLHAASCVQANAAQQLICTAEKLLLSK